MYRTTSSSESVILTTLVRHPLSRFRPGTISARLVISTLSTTTLALHAALDALRQVGADLPDLGLDGLIRVGGADALEAVSLLLSLASVRAVELAAGLALHGTGEGVGVVDVLARRAGHVEGTGAGRRVHVRVQRLAGRLMDRVRLVRVLTRGGSGRELLCAELGNGLVANLLA